MDIFLGENSNDQRQYLKWLSGVGPASITPEKMIIYETNGNASEGIDKRLSPA